MPNEPRKEKPKLIDRIADAGDTGFGTIGERIRPAVEKGVSIASIRIPAVPAALAAGMLASQSFDIGKAVGTQTPEPEEKGRATQQETAPSALYDERNRQNLKDFENSLRGNDVTFADVKAQLDRCVSNTMRVLGMADTPGNKLHVLGEISQLIPRFAVRIDERGKAVNYAIAGYLASEVGRQMELIAFGSEYAKRQRPRPEEDFGGWDAGPDSGYDQGEAAPPEPEK